MFFIGTKTKQQVLLLAFSIMATQQCSFADDNNSEVQNNQAPATERNTDLKKKPAKEEHKQKEFTEASSEEGTKYKGRINNEVSRSSGSSSSEKPQGDIFLRADIETRDGNLKCDVEPYYTDDSKLTEKQYATLVNSPLVQSRVSLWKAWYSRIYEEITDGVKPPKGLREKINVTVSKSNKVTATVEWMDSTEDESVKACAKQILNKIRSFETTSWIAFPEKSYLELVKFDFYVTFDGFQLGNGIQKLDID